MEEAYEDRISVLEQRVLELESELRRNKTLFEKTKSALFGSYQIIHKKVDGLEDSIKKLISNDRMIYDLKQKINECILETTDSIHKISSEIENVKMSISRKGSIDVLCVKTMLD